MNKISATMNRKGYRHERVSNSKVPYLLIFVILALLYIMSHLYGDNKSLYVEKESLNYEIMESDSVKIVLGNKIKRLEKELDSIKSIKPISKPLYKRRKGPIVTPVTVMVDTIN